MNVFWLSKKEIFPKSFSKFLAEHDIILSRICTDPDHAVYEYLQSQAELIIMDFSWYSSDVSGISLLQEFLSLGLNMKVIIVTSYFQEIVSNKFRDFGACGYFTKNDLPEDIIRCIKEQGFISEAYRVA